MEMVAASKLRRFQDFLESSRPYTEKLSGLVHDLLGEVPTGYRHPFIETPSPEERDAGKEHQLLVLFTSDTGLCGTYNSEIENTAHRWLKDQSGKKILLAFVGKHGVRSFQKYGGETIGSFSDLRVSRVDEILEGLEKTLKDAFLDKRVAEVRIAYTRMESLSRFQPTVEKLLPFSKLSVQAEANHQTIIEPDAQTVLDRLFPAFFAARLRFIFYHALLTEQISRMNAMRQATKNAKDMIDGLTLQRNKARQASITKEIIEIVSGSRALKLK